MIPRSQQSSQAEFLRNPSSSVPRWSAELILPFLSVRRSAACAGQLAQYAHFSR